MGALVALLVTPQFRALNRISVFVAFFSIVAVVVAIDRAVGRLGATRARVTFGAAAALVAGVTAPVRLRFSLHPGWNTARFETDGPAVYPEASRDSRPLAFMVAELQLRQVSRGQEPGSR